MLQDNVYTFFGDRYIKEEAKFAAVHDFLSAVIMYSKDYRVSLTSLRMIYFTMAYVALNDGKESTREFVYAVSE